MLKQILVGPGYGTKDGKLDAGSPGPKGSKPAPKGPRSSPRAGDKDKEAKKVFDPNKDKAFVTAYFSKAFSEELSADNQYLMTTEEKFQNL